MDECNITLYLIYLENGLLLSKKHYDSWQQIQDEYETYKASLGPWSAYEVIEFFQDDYGVDEREWPFSQQQIKSFVHSDQQVITGK